LDGYIIGAIVATFMVIAVAMMVRSIHSQQKKLQRKISEQFGQVPDNIDLEFDSISRPWKYCTDKDVSRTIDDITWNDLDMNEVFARINNCQSSLGEEYLYLSLHMRSDDDKLSAREVLMEYLDHEPVLRQQIQTYLQKVGKSNYNGLIEFISSPEVYRLDHDWIYKIFALLPIVSLLLFPLSYALGTACIIGSICFNILISYFTKRKIAQQLPSVRYFSGVLWCCQKICKMKGEGLSELQQSISKRLSVLHGLKGAVSGSMQNRSAVSDMDVFAEYVRMVTLHEILNYNKSIRLISANKESCREICEDVAELDVAIAVLSFRKSLPFYSKPHYVQNMQLNLQELYHPLLHNAVANSVLFAGDSLITGSNASGKSTFIKAVAVNGILAMALNTCTARVYQAPKGLVLTSMAMRDNLLSGDSYFVAEIKSLKRVLDRVKVTTCLCFIDEILKGTNTIERIAASTAVLRYLHQQNSICLVASHDSELTQILKNEFENYHFSEQITNNEIIFDYLIKPGPSKTTNAVKLLAYTNYDVKIIQDAEAMVRKFEDTGNW